MSDSVIAPSPIDGVADEHLGIRMRDAAQVGDQALQRVVVGADLLAVVLLRPVFGLGAHQRHELLIAWQPQIELGGQAAQLLRHGKLVREQHERVAELLVVEGDVFQVADHRGFVGEVGVEVAEHVKRRALGPGDVRQQGLRVFQVSIAVHISAEAAELQPAGDPPLVEGQLALHGEAQQHGKHATLIVGFHHHDGDLRVEDQTQVLCVCHASLTILVVLPAARCLRGSHE